MLTFRCRRLWPAVLIAGPTLAAAGAPSPLDASAAVAPVIHESAFRNYRRHADVAPRDWKATNDTVGRIGGWRAYAREANAPTAASPGTAASAAPAASQGHHGHGPASKAVP